MPKRFLLVVAGATLAPFAAATQEWPQWRGPHRDGVVVDFVAPPKWPASLKLVWEVPVGSGYSSPVVSQDQVCVLARTHAGNDGQESVSCHELKTGRTLWRNDYPVSFSKNKYALKMEAGPFSTPLLHSSGLYTFGVSAILSRFDAKTGKLKWRRDFSSLVDTSNLFTGTAMSPAIEAGRLIVHVGDDREGRMLALDPDSGKEIWTWKGDGPGYASPVFADLEGARQLITLTDKSAVGVSVDSGKLLWKMPFPDEWNENVVTPVLYKNLIILSGVRKGTLAVQVRKDGGEWSVKQVWHNPDIAMYLSTPVLDGDHLFGLSQKKKGQFFCLDAGSGSTLWITAGRDADNAAVLNAGSVLFFLTVDAGLIVARKSAQNFEPLARYKVGESATWAHPVILGKQVLIKSASTLALWSME